MAKIRFPNGSKKKSRFFALKSSGDSYVATFPSPRKVVEIFKKNSRNRDKVFTINGN